MSLDHLWAGWRSSYVSSFDADRAAAGPGQAGEPGRGEAAAASSARSCAPSEPDDVRHVLWTGKFTAALSSTPTRTRPAT